VTRLLARFSLSIAVLLLLPSAAFAQGLGGMTVKSAVGQPLRAEVSVTSLNPGKDAGFHTSIATPDEYKALGLEFNAYLYSIRVTPETRGKDTVLVLTSSRAVQEPFLEIVIVLQSATGRVTRKYTVLFDSK
jgi:pilus assembly protein FimV